MLMLGELCGA